VVLAVEVAEPDRLHGPVRKILWARRQRRAATALSLIGHGTPQAAGGTERQATRIDLADEGAQVQCHRRFILPGNPPLQTRNQPASNL